MTATSSFTGPAFNLLSAVQMSGTVVRVRYSIDPLLVNDTGVNDGLNPANYALSGPIAAVIGDVNVVTDDTQAVDLVLVAPLVTGTWAVTVSNVQTADGANLSNPTTLAFDAVTTPTVTDPNAGAVNIDAKDVLRRHLSPAFKGRAWDAVLEALAVGDKANADNAQLAFDQLFKCTASGKYLDKVCADDNVRRPALLGMSDEPFRQYAIKTTNERLTPKSIWEILEVFYGSDAVKANATTINYEPFNLTDGETLTFCVDELQDIEVEFKSSDFVSASAATALEVAAAITRACAKASAKAYALPYFEPESKTTRVRVFSDTIGPKSSVRITGGTAQAKLQFPGLVPEQLLIDGSAWDVFEDVLRGTVRFTTTSLDVDSYPSIKSGDYVIVTDPALPLQGAFTVSRVGETANASWSFWFEVIVDRQYDFTPNPITIFDTSGVAFYRSIKNTVSVSDRGIVVSSTPSGTTVSVPATTQTVDRASGSAAYAQLPASLPVISMAGLHDAMVVDVGPHSIQTGDHVIVDGAYPSQSYPSYAAPSYNGTMKIGTFARSPIALTTTLSSMVMTAQKKYPTSCYGNRRAFVFGGMNAGGSAIKNWLYIETSDDGSFSVNEGTTMPTAVYGSQAVMHGADCPNYWAVAVVHGLTAAATPTNKIQIAGKNMSWSEVAVGTARSNHAAVACSNGRIFVGPGTNGGTGAVDECFTFVIDPSNALHQDADTYNVKHSRYDYGACAFGDGSVLLVGGRNPSDAVRLSDCEVFEFGVGTRRIAPMSCPRARPGVAKLPDGRIMVVGDDGLTVGAVGLQSAEIWDPATEKWEKLPPPNQQCSSPFVYWNDVMQKVVVIARRYSGYGNAHAEAFDPITGKWTNIYTPAAVAGLYHSGMCAGDGFAFNFGGIANISGTAANNVAVMTPGELTLSIKNVNGLYKAIDVSSTTITIASSESGYFRNASATATVTPVKAPSSDAIGPYLFNPNSGFAITGVATATTQSIEADRAYGQVSVSDSGDFPNGEGWLVFGFGTEYETGPVRYLRSTTGTLVLDSNFKFPAALPSGVTVTLLANRGPLEPENVPGSFYLTASSAGRIAAQDAVIEGAPLGVPFDVDISYPSDRGLGNEGRPSTGADKLSDKVAVWGGDDLDSEIEDLREE